jgi:hypothetical protein
MTSDLRDIEAIVRVTSNTRECYTALLLLEKDIYNSRTKTNSAVYQQYNKQTTNVRNDFGLSSFPVVQSHTFDKPKHPLA